MKKITDFGKLFFIWVITILFFSVSFTIYAVAKMDLIKQEEFIILFIIIIIFPFCFGLLFSVPQFVLFAGIGFWILQTNWSVRIKKLLLLAINYINILVTCTITFMIIWAVIESDQKSSGEKDYNGLLKYVFWYPNWVIIFTSTIAILLMPFGNKKPILTNQSNYENT